MQNRSDNLLLSSEDIFFILAAISPHRENNVYNSIFRKLSDFLISKDHDATMNNASSDDKYRAVEAMRAPIDAGLVLPSQQSCGQTTPPNLIGLHI